MRTIRINIYRDSGVWFAARWVDGEYDGCDALGCDDNATEGEACEAAMTMPLVVKGERVVCRVPDLGGKQ